MNSFCPIVSFQALLLTRNNSALSRTFREDCRPLPCLCLPPASGAGDVIFLNIPGCCASGQYLKILRTSDAAGRRLLVVVFFPPVCLPGYCARLSMSRSVKVRSSVLSERGGMWLYIATCWCRAFSRRAQELCETRGGLPGFHVLNSPYDLCGRKATFTEEVTVSQQKK